MTGSTFECHDEMGGALLQKVYQSKALIYVIFAVVT